ncbi:MAG: GNAT family N-acetyltransferase [Clostridia bacterium]|nr:GNAT family N-acetyltransferase [Clostridia bacterium]
MSLKITAAETQKQINKIYELYMNAFPEIERKPFSFLLDKQKDKSVDLLYIENDIDEFVGEAISVKYKDMILLDYFAMDSQKRGNGYGSQALKLLIERYSEKRFILEIERDDVECENLEQRKRRKKFYLKNGMKLMNFNVNLFGEEMNILTYNCRVTFEEYHSIYKNVFGDKYANKVVLVK